MMMVVMVVVVERCVIIVWKVERMDCREGSRVDKRFDMIWITRGREKRAIEDVYKVRPVAEQGKV